MTLSHLASHPDSCGCCAGRDVEIPYRLYNLPAQPAIAYRIGRHGSFKESLLARLSAADRPALKALRTREDGDFSVALCDAAATLLDVMTFYQERIANEHYLRTATEAGSIRELARLIGYRPAPGVAANVELAFTLDEAPGAPELAALPVTLPVGTRAQSVPGPDETPQTFETIEEVEARPGWNAIPVWAEEPQTIAAGTTSVLLVGTATLLAPGDAVLIVGTERVTVPASEQWDVRVVQAVREDAERNTTRVEWKVGLRDVGAPVIPAAAGPRFFVFRQRAALFGHNAPNPNLLSSNGTGLDILAPADPKTKIRQWNDYGPPSNVVDLDASYPRIAPGSWFALVNQAIPNPGASLAGLVRLYRVDSVGDHSRAQFGLSAKVTRLTPDTTAGLSQFALSETQVLAQSEELALGAQPLAYPLYDTELALARVEPDLKPGRKLAVKGKRVRVEVARGAPAMKLILDDGTTRDLAWGDSLQVSAAPETVAADGMRAVVAPVDLPARMAGTQLAWRLLDRDGRAGSLLAPAASLRLQSAWKTDKELAEIVQVDTLAPGKAPARDRTAFKLKAPLNNVFDRATTTVNANVAGATAGESVGEILGNGDAARPDQRFALKQAPLTFVSAATPEGRAVTVEVRVNGIKWEELPSLYGADPTRRTYALQMDEGGAATVVFGDGTEGARVPTGIANVRATYRKGIGEAGNVAANRIKTLLTQPLGVNGVINPEPGYGGQDPETLREARRRAPITVLTLDRAVSVLDYADFARNFAGIAKAHAALIGLGPGRGVFVTVAGPRGAQPPADGATIRHLVDSLRRNSDAQTVFAVRAYEPLRFHLKAGLKIDPAALAPDVLARVRAALLERFGFDAREFGQPVSQDELVAAMHGADGVVAVSLAAFHLEGRAATVERILWPHLPVASLTRAPQPAQLLVIDPDRIELGAMA